MDTSPKMSSKVVEFLYDSGGTNFTETAPRPPVPGEENEVHSNGGMSTRSSGSHKSHVSSRSQASSKSHVSSKSLASNKGEAASSPSATPRKSKLDRGLGGSLTGTALSSDQEAPLGFEPEGSVSNSPPFTENSTPPHLKWAENLHYLLNDSEGVELFKEFLDKEYGGSQEVDFWFACQGLKQKDPSAPNISSLVKAIFKSFVRSDRIKCLNKETKQDMFDKISQRTNLDKTIFDVAQKEVENYTRDVTYPAFLNSDYYVQYVQTYGDSPKSSHSSGSNSARPVSQSMMLPPLPEDEELDSSVKMPTMGPPSVSRFHRSRKTETFQGHLQYTSKRDSYPAHVSYAPVSAVDSELQSQSSDALTDDTVSLTDSSVDGYPRLNQKKARRKLKSLAQQNREPITMLHSQFIPRTDRGLPKDRNTAETEPQRFAEMLIEKLNKVVQEQECGAKVEEKIRQLDESEKMEDKLTSSFAKNTTSSSIMSLLPRAPEDENAEAILEEHCSRIWASSNHHTPSRSPGRHSPQSQSPERSAAVRKLSQTQPALAKPGHGRTTSHRKRDNREFISSFSCDSGVGEEKAAFVCGTETHRHIHHHHHHHHPFSPRELNSSKWLEIEARCSVDIWKEGTSRSFTEYQRGAKKEESSAKGRKHAKGNGRKGSDASSNIDSGISMAESLPPINWSNPTNEKVMQWMMRSEKVQEASTTYADSEKSLRHKGSHRSQPTSTNTVPPTHKQSSGSKKAGVHSASRSTSVERSAGMPRSQILPSQPFIQDPAMPLPPPPNPTTQLEEAKRRLEDQSRANAAAAAAAANAAGPVKSKSFAGVPSREKSRAVSTTPTAPSRPMPSARTVPCDLDTASSQPSQTLERPKSKKQVSSSTATDTIIGIYFGQEPIPYRHVLPGKSITLGQFKTLILKKGNFKYFFKRDSDEFGEGAVFEEIVDDNATLPLWEDKVVAKIEKFD